MKTVFFDVDTQIDFLFPAGALYVPGAEKIVNPLGELARFAASKHFQIISTADAHSENDPEFKIWKPHCIANTTGQQKVANTLLSRPVVLSSAADSLQAMQSGVETVPQIVVEKQGLDCFTNPNLRPLLNMIGADRYVVYGVATEHCVRCAVFGLLETGARVELVTDAIAALSASDEREVVQRFQGRGGHLITTRVALS